MEHIVVSAGSDNPYSATKPPTVVNNRLKTTNREFMAVNKRSYQTVSEESTVVMSHATVETDDRAARDTSSRGRSRPHRVKSIVFLIDIMITIGVA